jgi:DNA repair protein RadC
MKGQLSFGFDTPPPKAGVTYHPKEFKVVALRDCPLPEHLQLVDTPERADAYWRLHVTSTPYFNPDTETSIVLLLNTRRRVKGHALVSIGTLDTALVHAREVFRPAIGAAASAVILLHNHPSGDPTPSDADVRVSRDLHRAGQLLKIDLLDSIVIGAPGKFASLRSLGHLY